MHKDENLSKDIYCRDEIQQEEEDLNWFKSEDEEAKYSDNIEKDKSTTHHKSNNGNNRETKEEMSPKINQTVRNDETDVKYGNTSDNEDNYKFLNKPENKYKNYTLENKDTPWSWRCTNKTKKFTMTGRIKEDLDNDRNQRSRGDKRSEEVIWEKTPKKITRFFRKKRFIIKKLNRYGRKQINKRSLRRKIFKRKEEVKRSKDQVINLLTYFCHTASKDCDSSNGHRVHNIC